jgi:hypothetical protein
MRCSELPGLCGPKVRVPGNGKGHKEKFFRPHRPHGEPLFLRNGITFQIYLCFAGNAA